MEIKLYPLSRKQTKFIRKVGDLADQCGLTPTEMFMALSTALTKLKTLDKTKKGLFNPK